MPITKAGSTLLKRAYTHDANSNVRSINESFVGQILAGAFGPFASPDGGQMGRLTKANLEMLSQDGAEIAADWRSSKANYTPQQKPTISATDIAILWCGLLLTLGLFFYSRFKHRWLPAMPLATSLLLVSCGGGGGSSGSAGGVETPGGAGSQSGTSPPPNGSVAAKASFTSYAYDAVDRLISADIGTDVQRATGSPKYEYRYDAAFNLTSMTGDAPKSLGVTATNALGNGTYNANGSPTLLGAWTYQWDGANRIVAASNGNNQSTFTYDGWSRIVRIVDKQGATITRDRSYVWCRFERCQERDNLLDSAI